MTTDEDYAEIAQAAYNVDPKWRKLPWKENHRFPPGNPRFIILNDPAPVSDPVTGLQGIAVAPLVNGEPDYGHVFVAFAGTNPADHADLNADSQEVMAGKSVGGTQAAEAKEYAKKVRSRVLAKHPEATFDTVGHSLGGHVATLVASDLHWSSTTFNSPDPWDAMSPEQREWLTKEIAAGRNPFRNFVNEWDPIGNSRGNTSGTAIFVHGLPGQDPLQYHNLDTGFHFTDGRITDITKTGRSRLEITENLLQGVPPAYRTAVAAGVSGAMTVLRNPLVGESVGRSVSAMLVAMDTLAAASLASSIFSTSDLLTQVKSVNSSLVPQLQVSLDDACRAVSGIPYITATDIENCVITERLRVSDNIDEHAVTAVNRLVDDHVATVHRLTAGIGAAMSNAVEQDARWASIFAGR